MSDVKPIPLRADPEKIVLDQVQAVVGHVDRRPDAVTYQARHRGSGMWEDVTKAQAVLAHARGVTIRILAEYRGDADPSVRRVGWGQHVADAILLCEDQT